MKKAAFITFLNIVNRRLAIFLPWFAHEPKIFDMANTVGRINFWRFQDLSATLIIPNLSGLKKKFTHHGIIKIIL